MPYQYCESCNLRYYQRRDGSRPHSCQRRKQARLGPRKPRAQVPCVWPDCANLVPVLIIQPDRHHQYIQYRMDGFAGAGLVKHPLCESHRRRIFEALGPLARMNGIKAILRLDNEDLAGSAVNAPMTRLVVYDSSGGCCRMCKEPLDFKSKWHLDHITPMFKGGRNMLGNMQVLCQSCHHVKSAPEKREANGMRQKLPNSKRWMTHRHKDEIIAKLQAELDALKNNST